MECAVDMTVEDQERLKFIRKRKVQVIKNIESLKLELYDITNQIESLGFPVDCDDIQLRQCLMGCREFNLDPKQGLQYLLDHGLVDESPESLANFFMNNNKHLLKSVLGNFLGEVRKEFNVQVLDAFTRLHDFKNQEFLPCLRRFLLGFQLPGESQKIDRILTSFADWYFEQNPSVFNSAHESYVLAYAAILLNTTLHNANAKAQSFALAEEKTFVRTMLDYDSETNLSEDLIRKIYHDIKTQPIQPAIDDGFQPGNPNVKCIMKGWLLKLGGRVKTWKRRWFVLTEDSLLYYATAERQHQPKGSISLDGLSIRQYHDRTRDNTFELFSHGKERIKSSKSDRDGTSTPGCHSVFRLAAQSIAERDKWMRMLDLVTRRIGERRAVRSTSVDCGTGSTTGSSRRTSVNSHHLTSPMSSASLQQQHLKRSGALGSHPDLSSQSVFN